MEQNLQPLTAQTPFEIRKMRLQINTTTSRSRIRFQQGKMARIAHRVELWQTSHNRQDLVSPFDNQCAYRWLLLRQMANSCADFLFY